MNEADAALLRLIETLRARDYHFITPTPATHARVIAREDRRRARDLADVLGWSLPFAPEGIDADVLDLLRAADALAPAGEGLFKATVRVSCLTGQLFVHSAYPTEDSDAVFFGPDSYRFAQLIEAELPDCQLGEEAHIVDIGTGAGVGAIVAARMCPDARVTMTDVNPAALRLAAVNARAAGLAAQAVESDDLAPVQGPIDVALANPPYIMDDGERAYRDGGGLYGGQVSLDMTRMAVERLAPGGRVILYTGSTVVRGRDVLREALEGLAAERGLGFRYRELDPDVFGEELDQPAYAEADRIAVVAAVLTRAA
jgi:methylase of polypeptide subunit release factors